MLIEYNRVNPNLKLTTMLNVALLLFPTGQAASLWSTVVSFSSRWDHPCGEYQHCEPHLTLSCPCLNIEIVFRHIVVCVCVFFYLVCFIMQLLGNCHRTERSQRRKEMINFWGNTPHSSSYPNPLLLTSPWPLHLLLLLTSTSHNYFAKELQKKNTQSNFSFQLWKAH